MAAPSNGRQPRHRRPGTSTGFPRHQCRAGKEGTQEDVVAGWCRQRISPTSSRATCVKAGSSMPPTTEPHVVIVGGGFGGLHAARMLTGQPVRVTLLDRRNHHLFQPLLYQVATAALNASDIAAPLRSVLRRARNVTVLLAEVERVDLAARRLVLDRGEIGYDAL